MSRTTQADRQQIKVLRSTTDLSLREIAEAVGCSVSTVQYWIAHDTEVADDNEVEVEAKPKYRNRAERILAQRDMNQLIRICRTMAHPALGDREIQILSGLRTIWRRGGRLHRVQDATLRRIEAKYPTTSKTETEDDD